MPQKTFHPSGFASLTARDDAFDRKTVMPHTVPVYATSTFIYESVEKAQKVFEGKEQAFIYARWSHPNAVLVEDKLEKLETFQTGIRAKALVFSSGMSAISTLFQSVLRPGDAVLAQGNIYGTTVDYFKHHQEHSKIAVFFADFARHDEVECILKQHKNIRLVYAESPANPTLSCYDLTTLSALAHRYGAKMAVDNTFASPYLQQPFRFGVDFVVYSATKYLNGHGTALSGFVLGRDVKFVTKELWRIRKLNGSICSPFDAWLLNMGMKTLALRMEKHCQNTLAVAQYLQKHPAVAKVNYLGLKDHPDYELANKQMSGFGGVLSFELKDGYKAGLRLMKKVRFCRLTASLGTIDTLIQHPASMSHYFVPKAQREQFGISDGLIRLSVGVEDVQDIIADLEQALR